VPRNVCEAVDKPVSAKKEIRVWDGEQVAAFLEAAKESRLEALYILALATGLCQGELLGLQWQDADLKRGGLAVRRTLLEIRGKPSVGEPKTKAGKRSERPASRSVSRSPTIERRSGPRSEHSESNSRFSLRTRIDSRRSFGCPRTSGTTG
jgi:integrase